MAVHVKSAVMGNKVAMKLLKEKLANVDPKTIEKAVGAPVSTVMRALDKTVPFDVFLALVMVVGMKAGSFFEEAGQRMVADMKKAKAAKMASESPSTEVGAKAASSDTHGSQKIGEDPWANMPNEGADSDENTDQDIDNEEDDQNDDVEVQQENVPKPVDVDQSSPDALPFDDVSADFDVKAADVGLKGADAILMEWASCVNDVAKKSKANIKKLTKVMPKPTKVNAETVSLPFRSLVEKQGFLNSGLAQFFNDWAEANGNGGRFSYDVA